MVLAADAARGEPVWLAPVAGQVRQALSFQGLSAAYGCAVAEVLATPGGILSDTLRARWTGTVITCCTTAGGRWEQAVTAAAAVELFMAALDVLDGEEDGDSTPLRSQLGSARLLNVSTGLLLLAQRLLHATEQGSEALAILLPWALRACGGQDDDLRSEASDLMSLEQSLDVTERKSASLVAAACEIGALCGGADADLRSLYGQYGACLGMIAQLMNDLAAIVPGAEGNVDVALQRPTLPLTYAALTPPQASQQGADTGARAVWTEGAAHLTWAVAETFRQSALGLIPQLSDSLNCRGQLADLVCTL